MTTLRIVAIPTKHDGIGYLTEMADFCHRENVEQTVHWTGKWSPEAAAKMARDHASLAVAERPGRYPCHLAVLIRVAKGCRAPAGFGKVRDTHYLPAAEFRA